MYEINNTEVSILEAVARGCNNNLAISKEIGRTTARTSVVVNGLCKKGFLEKKRAGLAYRIDFTSQWFVNMFIRLIQVQRPTIDCLTDSGLTIVALLNDANSPLTRIEITERTGMSSATVGNLITIGVRRGVLKKSGKGYAISSSMATLKEFVESYRDHTNLVRIRMISSEAVIHWELGFEFIFSISVKKKTDFGAPTAVTAFGRDGVEFLSNREYYHYHPYNAKAGPEEYILDNAILNPSDSRNILNSLIYLKKNFDRMDVTLLRKISKIYGIEELSEAMLDFIMAKECSYERFPGYDEFIQKYEMYKD